MLWARFKMTSGEPISAMSPLAYSASMTIVKTGVCFWKKNGDLLRFVPNEEIAEVVDDDWRYKQHKHQMETAPGRMYTWYSWEKLEPKRDNFGRIIT